MEALYSTIFVAILALFGLLIAALIYVAQTVQDRYSTRLAQRLLKGRLSLAFWVAGFVTLALSCIELFTEAYPRSRIVLHFQLDGVITDPLYGIAAVSGVFISLLLFLWTLRNYARLLSPLTVLEEIARGLNPYTVRNIAILRLHEELPRLEMAEDFETLIAQLRDEPEESRHAHTEPAPPAKMGVTHGLKARIRRAVESHRRTKPSKVQSIKKKLGAKERARKLEDPLGDLFEYALSALSKNNALAWRAFSQRLILLFDQSARSGLLVENVQIPFLGDALALQGLERLHEEIEITRRFSFLLELNRSIQGICGAFMSAASWNRAVPFLSFLEDIAARALARHDGEVFRSSVGVLTSLGVLSMKQEPNSQVFDDVCRKIGWLGEKLILRGIEESPAMPSGNESAELGEITESIYNLLESVVDSDADKYPLILRDAIEVICNQALKKNEPRKFEETLLSLFGIHKEIAENLIAKESQTAGTYLWLVLHYFKEVLDQFDLSAYRELRKDIFSWAGGLATAALEHNRPAGEFWGANIPGERDLCGLIVSFMVEMGEPEDWNGPMFDLFIRADRHHEEALNLVKRAGVQLHSNFGLLFDPATGQDYAPNDPRRR